MRLVFLSVDDEFAGRMQKYVYQHHPEWVVGSVVSTRDIYKMNKIAAFFFIIRKSGFYYLMQMVRMKVWRKIFSQGRKETPASLAKAHSKDLFHCANINAEASIEKVKAWRPDVLISTNFSHYLGKKIRSIPVFGTLNLHKSYLPYYRGMAPNFHALLEGANSVGATLHVVDDGFDTGPILWQVKVSVEQDDTVYTLNQKSSEQGGRMLADFLDNVNLERLEAAPQPAGDWKNYTYPSRTEITEFRKKGLRFDKV